MRRMSPRRDSTAQSVSVSPAPRSSSPLIVTLSALSDGTLDTAWQVGFEKAGIALSDRARTRIDECRKAFERLLASDPGFVYGATTAPGARAKTPLSEEGRKALASSQHLWAPWKFGGGNRWARTRSPSGAASPGGELPRRPRESPCRNRRVGRGASFSTRAGHAARRRHRAGRSHAVELALSGT